MTSGFLFIIGYLATVFALNIEVCFFTCGIIAGNILVAQTIKVHVLLCNSAGHGSSVGCTSAWYADGHGFDPHVRQHSFVEIWS